MNSVKITENSASMMKWIKKLIAWLWKKKRVVSVAVPTVDVSEAIKPVLRAKRKPVLHGKQKAKGYIKKRKAKRTTQENSRRINRHKKH
jgi:hypothetical protein